MTTRYADLIIEQNRAQQGPREPVEPPAELLTAPPDEKTEERRATFAERALGALEQFDPFRGQPSALPGEFFKGLGRAGAFLAESAPDPEAALAGKFRQAVTKITGQEFLPLSVEERGDRVHEQIKAITSGEGFLAPAPQDKIFAWDDPKWWAGRSGEGIGFLIPIVAAARFGGGRGAAAGASPRMIKAIQASMTAAVSGNLERSLSFDDLRESLEQQGLSRDESTELAGMGSVAVGIVNGVLDILTVNRILKGIPGGRRGLMKLLLDIVGESVTEQLQEVVSLGAEEAFGIETKGTRLQRIAAAGASAIPTTTVVSALQPRALKTDANRQVKEEGPLRDMLDGLPPEQQLDLSTSLTQITTEARDPAAEATQDADDLALAEAVNADLQRRRATEEPVEPATTEAVEEARAVKDSRSVRAMRRGLADIGIFHTPVAAGAEAASGITNYFWLDMTDRLANRGGDQSKEAAVKSRKAIDGTKASLGRMEGPLTVAQRITGSFRRIVSVAKLQLPQWRPGKGYATVRLFDAGEGRIQNLTAGERIVVDSVLDLVAARGREFERVGLQQFDYATGEWVPFQVKGREIMPRVLHVEGMDVVRKGKGEAFNKLVFAIADINGVDEAIVKKSLQQMSADMAGKGERATFGRTQAELQRVFPQMPSHIKTKGGDPIQILETNPHSYVTRLAEMGANRVGFVSQFGQGIPGDETLSTLRQSVIDEGGDIEAFDDLMRVLNGLPATEPLIQPGSAVGAVARMNRHLLGVVKAGLMTLSIVPNIFEMIGAPATFLGTTELIRSTLDLALHPIALPAMLRQLGAITPNVKNMSFDPNRPFESITRWLREVIGRGIPRVQLEELQETMSAVMANHRVEVMQRGKGGAGDKLMLMQMMDWSDADAERVRTGDGTKAEYQAIVRRAPAFLTAGSIRAGEQARSNQNRVFKNNIAFVRYFEARMRSNLAIWEGVQIAAKSNDPKLMYASATQVARFLFGTTAQGALSALALALLTGGPLGLKIKLHEAKDDPLEFFGKSFLYSWLGGPWGQIVRLISDQNKDPGSFGTDLLRLSLPYFVFDEIRQGVARDGPYRNRTWGEVGGKFFGRMMPVSKLEGTFMSMVTFGQEDQKREVAIRGYWNWRFDEDPPGKTTRGKVDQDTQLFRTKMAQAYRAFKRTEDPSPFIMEALQITDVREVDVRAALRRRRLLSSLEDEQQLALRQRIGDNAYDQLIWHDAALDGWAESFQKPKRLK